MYLGNLLYTSLSVGTSINQTLLDQTQAKSYYLKFPNTGGNNK